MASLSLLYVCLSSDPGNKLQAIVCPALISQKLDRLAHKL